MNKIIDDGSNIIGSVEDVISYLKQEIIQQINSIYLQNLETNEIENMKDNVDKVLELINGLLQDYITEYISMDDLIKVNYDNGFEELFYSVYKKDEK